MAIIARLIPAGGNGCCILLRNFRLSAARVMRLTPHEKIDGTVVAQKYMAILRTGEKGFGIGYIIDILRGINSPKSSSNISISRPSAPVVTLSANVWRAYIKPRTLAGYMHVRQMTNIRCQLTDKKSMCFCRSEGRAGKLEDKPSNRSPNVPSVTVAGHFSPQAAQEAQDKLSSNVSASLRRSILPSRMYLHLWCSAMQYLSNSATWRATLNERTCSNIRIWRSKAGAVRFGASRWNHCLLFRKMDCTHAFISRRRSGSVRRSPNVISARKFDASVRRWNYSGEGNNSVSGYCCPSARALDNYGSSDDLSDVGWSEYYQSSSPRTKSSV